MGKTTHGQSNTHFYRVWASMLDRCKNPKSKIYPQYGGRGIKVCKRWGVFKNFSYDMAIEYHNHVTRHGRSFTSIDRINNNGDYSKRNCRWATRKEQSRNRRITKRFVVNGEVVSSIASLSDATGLPPSCIIARLKLGWSLKDVINTPLNKKLGHPRLLTFRGETMGVRAWCRKLGIHPASLVWRLNGGWTVKEALTTKFTGLIMKKKKR